MMEIAAITELLVDLRRKDIIDGFDRVGSRVTCVPAPTDTDDDYLLLAHSSTTAAQLQYTLAKDGWTFPVFNPKVEAEYEHGRQLEFTCRYDDINLIVVSDRVYYRNWLKARDVCAALNLMDKADRKLVHQIICEDL